MISLPMCHGHGAIAGPKLNWFVKPRGYTFTDVRLAPDNLPIVQIRMWNSDSPWSCVKIVGRELKAGRNFS